MDGQAWSKLEKMLIAQRVPRDLWPRFFESLRYVELRKLISEKDRLRIEYQTRLKRDVAEKKRRNAFSLFIIVMLWIIAEQQREQRKAQDFASRSLLVLSQTDHARHAGSEAVEKAVACSMLVSRFSYDETMRVLESDAACPGGLRHGRRFCDAAAAAAEKEKEAEKKELEPTTVDDVSAPNW